MAFHSSKAFYTPIGESASTSFDPCIYIALFVESLNLCHNDNIDLAGKSMSLLGKCLPSNCLTVFFMIELHVTTKMSE